jgi:hypothetical protein
MTAFVQLDVLGGALEAPPTRRTPVRAHMRRVQGPPPPSGVERRDAALAQHTQKEDVRAALEYVRAKLRTLYETRAATDPHHAGVTADDVDALLKEWAACPGSLRTGRQAWRGSVFAGKGWQLTGEYVRSARPEMNAHRNPKWRPVAVTPPTAPPPATRRASEEAQ